MAATIPEFTTIYPEFASIDQAQLSAQLTLAEGRINVDFGDRRTEAVYLELASALANSTKGRPARRVRGDNEQSVYEARLKMLKFEASMGHRVA